MAVHQIPYVGILRVSFPVVLIIKKLVYMISCEDADDDNDFSHDVMIMEAFPIKLS